MVEGQNLDQKLGGHLRSQRMVNAVITTVDIVSAIGRDVCSTVWVVVNAEYGSSEMDTGRR